MTDPVADEVRLLAEPLPALLTGVGPLPRVHAAVVDQIRLDRGAVFAGAAEVEPDAVPRFARPREGPDPFDRLRR